MVFCTILSFLGIRIFPFFQQFKQLGVGIHIVLNIQNFICNLAIVNVRLKSVNKLLRLLHHFFCVLHRLTERSKGALKTKRQHAQEHRVDIFLIII